MMFGYACNETDNYMPLSLELAHLLLKELAQIRKEGQLMQYLRPDSKSQVTIEYGDDGKPARIPSSAYGIGKLLDTSILCISSFLFIILFHLSCTLTKHCGI